VPSSPVRARPASPLDLDLSRQASSNERRAVLLALVAGGVVGLVVGLVCLLVLAPLFALVVFFVVGLLVAGVAWWGSEPLARRLVGARPADPKGFASAPDFRSRRWGCLTTEA
jgi:hypothetical protein